MLYNSKYSSYEKHIWILYKNVTRNQICGKKNHVMGTYTKISKKDLVFVKLKKIYYKVYTLIFTGVEASKAAC